MEKEIEDKKTKVDEMSSDFAKILKSCLEKMSERIDFGSQDWENKKNAGVEENAGASHNNISQHEN